MPGDPCMGRADVPAAVPPGSPVEAGIIVDGAVPLELGAEFGACSEPYARPDDRAADVEPGSLQCARVQRVPSDRIERYG